MTDTYELAAVKRPVTKKSARDTRAAGNVPAVVYGNGFESVTISVAYSDMLRTYRKAGTSSIIDLDIEGKKAKVLVHDMQLDPVRNEITHVDFHALNLKEKTTVHIPLKFVGESPAVKTHGGTFISSHDALDIRCLPTDIPHDIEIDISQLKELHDHVTVVDLGLDPSKFELMGMDEETVLCSVTGRAATEEEEQAAAGETAAVESVAEAVE